MPNRSRDWMNQALRDLAQAEDSKKAERHEWACFAAHQAAEKAVKALHLHAGQEAWGHVIATLLVELPVSMAARSTSEPAAGRRRCSLPDTPTRSSQRT